MADQADEIWGPGPFDNDAALQWAQDLLEEGSAMMLGATLGQVNALDEDDSDVQDWLELVAAAAIVAGEDELPTELQALDFDRQALAPLATQAIDRALQQEALAHTYGPAWTEVGARWSALRGRLVPPQRR